MISYGRLNHFWLYSCGPLCVQHSVRVPGMPVGASAPVGAFSPSTDPGPDPVEELQTNPHPAAAVYHCICLTVDAFSYWVKLIKWCSFVLTSYWGLIWSSRRQKFVQCCFTWKHCCELDLGPCYSLLDVHTRLTVGPVIKLSAGQLIIMFSGDAGPIIMLSTGPVTMFTASSARKLSCGSPNKVVCRSCNNVVSRSYNNVLCRFCKKKLSVGPETKLSAGFVTMLSAGTVILLSACTVMMLSAGPGSGALSIRVSWETRQR